ncbi:MAG: transcriptional initiation protein Tat [Haloferacaceae archaeon]
MRRREAVRSFVALAVPLSGCAGGLPGATGPRRAPTSAGPPPAGGPDVNVTDVDVREGPDGGLRVVASVENRGGAAATRQVVATVTVDGEEHVRSTEVYVPQNGRTEATIDFDVRYEAFVDGGNVRAEVA